MRVSYSCRGTRTLHHSPNVPQARPRELDAAAKVAAQPIGLFVQEDHAAARRALEDCVEGGERAGHAQVHLDDDLINSKPAGSALLPDCPLVRWQVGAEDPEPSWQACAEVFEPKRITKDDDDNDDD